MIDGVEGGAFAVDEGAAAGEGDLLARFVAVAIIISDGSGFRYTIINLVCDRQSSSQGGIVGSRLGMAPLGIDVAGVDGESGDGHQSDNGKGEEHDGLAFFRFPVIKHMSS